MNEGVHAENPPPMESEEEGRTLTLCISHVNERDGRSIRSSARSFLVGRSASQYASSHSLLHRYNVFPVSRIFWGPYEILLSLPVMKEAQPGSIPGHRLS